MYMMSLQHAEIEELLGSAEIAVRHAAAVCQTARQRLVSGDVVCKEDRSPVTIADLAAQAVVNLTLQQDRPEIAVVAEEDCQALQENPDIRKHVLQLVREIYPEADNRKVEQAILHGGNAVDYSGRYWSLDPIDGTKGFLRGDQYAVALGLVENGEPVLGVLGCPALPFSPQAELPPGVLFCAAKGAGALMKSLHHSHSRRIQTNHAVAPHALRFCESLEQAHAAHEVHARIGALLGVTAAPLRLDSQCKYAAVARGDADIYLRLPRNRTYREKVWDHAAGVAVVEAAGGRVSDCNGNRLVFHKGPFFPGTCGVIATAGDIHERVLAAVQQVQQAEAAL